MRRYGYSLLSKFLETLPKLKLIQNGTIVSVTLNENEGQKESVEEFILKQLKQSGRQGISLGTLGNRIHNEFQDFKPRDYGYSQFKQYMMSIQNVSLEDVGEQIRAYYEK